MLAGKRVLVTGASKGIGKDICVRLTKEYGAHVVALARNVEELQQLSGEIGCATVVCDLSDSDSVRSAFQKAGNLDCLVNNAGVAILEPFLEMKQESLEKTMSVNVTSVALLSQLFALQAIKRKVPGSIVNVSSQASQRALENHTSYCVSKAALDQLTRNMAMELGSHQIRVNAVNPTVVLTDMGKKAWSDLKKAGPMLDRIPLGHFAKPHDVTEVVAFLLSSKAAMVNGAVIPIEGGFWCT